MTNTAAAVRALRERIVGDVFVRGDPDNERFRRGWDLSIESGTRSFASAFSSEGARADENVGHPRARSSGEWKQRPAHGVDTDARASLQPQ